MSGRMRGGRLMGRGVVGAASLVAGGLIAGAPALAQEGGADGPMTLLTVEHTGLRSMVVDPRDAALVRALEMIPARISELPGDVPGMPVEAARAMRTMLGILSRPLELSVRYDPDAMGDGGGFGYGVVMGVAATGREDAERVAGEVNSLMAMGGGQPPPSRASTKYSGMREMTAPFGLLRMGARESRGGWRYEVHAGAVGDPEAGLADLPAPVRGMTTVARARMNFAALSPLADMAAVFGGGEPMVGQVIQQLQGIGLLGEGALRIGFQAGYTDTSSVTVMTMEGATRFADAMGLSVKPLSARDLRLAPADSTMASVSSVDFSIVREMVEMARAEDEQVGHALEQFREMTGVDPLADVVDALGGTMAVYMSESTGGGGLGSLVLLLEIKDRARLSGAMERLRTFANSMADQSPLGPGRIRLSPWSHEGTEYVSLRFGGLPIPLEVTHAVAGEWLVMSLTPQGAIAAVRQATGKGDAGLGSVASVSRRLEGRSATSVSYVDSSRYARSGYVLTSMLASAVANGVRSAEREPGLVMPSFKELTASVQPSVKVSYWSGENYVTESVGDRSLLVNVSAGLGLVKEYAPLLAPVMIAAVREGRMGFLDVPEAQRRVYVWAAQRLVPMHPTALLTAAALSGASGEALTGVIGAR